MKGRVHNVVTSVARPGRPRYMRSVMGKIYRGLEWNDQSGTRHYTYFLKVGGDAQSLVSEPEVGSDCDAAFADHGHDGPSVIFHYRL